MNDEFTDELSVKQVTCTQLRDSRKHCGIEEKVFGFGTKKPPKIDWVQGIPNLLRSICAKENNFAVIDILVVYNVILIVMFLHLQMKWHQIYYKVIVNTCHMMLLS